MNEPGSWESSPEPPQYQPGATTLWNNSWRDIYNHFGQAIIAFSRRQGLNDHSAEDVLQEVMATLIRCQNGLASGFDPARGTFQAWLWAIIRNRVHAVRRKDRKEEIVAPTAEHGSDTRSGPRRPEPTQLPADFATLDEEEWQRALLAAAMKKMEERVKPKSFGIYKALLEESASPEELAARHNMNTNAIYAVKHRCEEILLGEAHCIRQAWEQLRKVPARGGL